MSNKNNMPSIYALGSAKEIIVIWHMRVTFTIYRGSYIRAHVLLNLLNELGKRDKM